MAQWHVIAYRGGGDTMIRLRLTLLSMILFFTAGLFATERQFYLSIEENFSLTTPDSTPLTAWAFRLDDEAPSVPGPVLDVIQGDEVILHFNNTSTQSQTLHFHGLDVIATQDGFPGLNNDVAPGGSATFQFTADHVGNFAYIAMGDGPRSRLMGLYGLVKVRLFSLDAEYNLISQGLDPAWHAAEPENPGQYAPQMLMISGHGMGDGDDWSLIPNLITTHDSVRLNLFNAGFWPQQISFPAGAASIVSADGRGWSMPEVVEDLMLYPGERYGIRLRFSAPGEYSGNWSILNPLLSTPRVTRTWHQSVIDGALIPGDLNNDGMKNIQDIVQLVAIILGELTPTTNQLYAADVNSDGNVDVTDVATLVQQILGQ